MNEVGFTYEPNKHPFCLVCNKIVDEWGYTTPIETAHSMFGSTHFFYTGEIIIWVKCHGEQWKASNIRGIL